MASGCRWLTLQNILIRKEMGFSIEEFERTLPAAVNHRPRKKTPHGFRVEIDSGSLDLVISEQKFRHIGAFSLPYLDVDFRFCGLTESEVEETMRFFNLRFQRGGG